MSRAFSFLGAAGAGICGILIMKTTLQPELEALDAERRGELRQHQQQDDRAISAAIMSDLKEAKQQVAEVEKGGFAWGIRQAIWGKDQDNASRDQTAREQDSLAPETHSNESSGGGMGR